MDATFDPAPSRSPASPTMPPSAIPLGSGYYLEDVIGLDDLGMLWRGRRRSDGGPVAVKVLRGEYSTDPDVIGRFLRERRTLRELRHPHLVPIEDLIVDGDVLATVMTHVDGEDVGRVARQGRLDRGTAIAVVARVARALAHVHAAGLSHQGVRPENILVARHEDQVRVYLTGFGLAWLAGRARHAEHSRGSATRGYLAPEVLAGNAYEAAADVYALGVTASELLREAHAAGDGRSLTDPGMTHQPPPDVPDDVWRVVRACLATRPEERPTAADLAIRLGDLPRSTRARPLSRTAARLRLTARHDRPRGDRRFVLSTAGGRMTGARVAISPRIGFGAGVVSGLVAMALLGAHCGLGPASLDGVGPTGGPAHVVPDSPGSPPATVRR